MQHNEVDLDACIAGDRDAWHAFVDQYSRVIYAAVHRTLGGAGGSTGGASASIEDPVQDVFVRLLRNDCRLLRSYDPARAALTTWLTLIARSVAIDHLRKRHIPTVSLGSSDSVGPAATVSSRESSTETTTPDPPLHVLSERQGLVLRMLFDEDLSVVETARRLGVDQQTVRSTKHKALTRLREHMSDPANTRIGGDAGPKRPVQGSGGDNT